ncbi:hypothetical protein BO70DRAFT_356169 [Aspergillus heteromorphus CBS 117.55]|uniref:Uncharacterized protein n=1 Tax=Aspergillus heteromorphus CBS 117.55 TaxID=1448321 RepID=A0A317V5Y4_9EURO|nr:uncharacterized protein BO70DRAFT_356169 [Aspergillus heteromorphus CBS 117.55]PWY68458.1 hypothetical protein BO70DRAFT_356169 [Aspergillus heteromorphus CBS 117.55]
MVLARPHILRASARAVGIAARRPPTRQFARRTYAQSHEAPKSSDLPWLIASVGLGVPAAYYIFQSRPQKKAHHGHEEEPKAEPVKEEEEKEAKAPAGEAAPQPDPESEQKVESSSSSSNGAPSTDGKAPSEADEPASRKEPASSATISAKQEGVSNADTSHPSVNEPGKSVKGEGETETAKVKGAVSPERPQA